MNKKSSIVVLIVLLLLVGVVIFFANQKNPSQIQKTPQVNTPNQTSQIDQKEKEDQNKELLKFKVTQLEQLLRNQYTTFSSVSLKKAYESRLNALKQYLTKPINDMQLDQLNELEKQYNALIPYLLNQKKWEEDNQDNDRVIHNNDSKPSYPSKPKPYIPPKPAIPPKPSVPPTVVVNKLPETIDTALAQKIDKIMEDWIKNEYIPGGVVLVAKDGKVIAHQAYGYRQIARFDDTSVYHSPNYLPLENKPLTTKDTLFDLASVTKVMATTQAVMKLVDEGKLDLNQPVHYYLPGFEKNGKRNVIVKSLLTHTSGLPQWEPTYFYGDTKQQQLDFIKSIHLNPKFVLEGINLKKHRYSDLGFMTLGYIVEAITQKDLDDYVNETIYQPLGLKQITYNPLAKKLTNIAATSLGNPYEYKMVDETTYPKVGYDTTVHQEKFKVFNGWRKEVLIGKVNDGNAGMATKGVAGHAGLFATAQDLAVINEMMLNHGTYNGVQIYRPEVVSLFTSKQTNTQIISEEFGYAFKLDQSWMGDSASEKVYGHDGFTGTYVVNDPEHHLQIIVLTNKMKSGFRKGTLPNGKPHNTNLYWNISSMVKAISNEVRTHLGF